MYAGIKVQNGGNTVDLNNLPKTELGELILEGVDTLKIFVENGATYSEANFEILDNNNDIKVKFVDSEGNDIFLILKGLNDILLANADEVPVFEVFEGTETLLSLRTIEDLQAAAAGGTSSDVATADAVPADELDLGTNLDAPINPLGFGGLAGPFVVDPAYPLDVTFFGDLTGTVTEDIGESEDGIITGTLLNDDPHYGPFSYVAETITGLYGTFTIDEDGNWTYDLDETSEVIQGLADGESLLDGITVTLSNLITTFTIDFTINGLNDKPEIEDIDINALQGVVVDPIDEEGEGSEILDEPTAPILYETATAQEDDIKGVDDTASETDNIYTGVINIVDVDVTNTHIVSIVPESLTVTDPSNAGITQDDVSISITQNEETNEWEYSVGGNFNELAVGETATVTFQYQADDQRGFAGDPEDDDTTNEDSLSDIKTITLTITGTNDQPIVEDISLGDENSFWQLLADGADYETIENLNEIAITNDDSEPTNGSAIKFTITSEANEIVNFAWDFFDAEDNSSEYNDFSFVIIDGVLTPLEDVISTDVNGNTILSHEFLTSGTHNITFGVFNSSDTAVDSGLNVQYISGGTIVDVQSVGNVVDKIYETSHVNNNEDDDFEDVIEGDNIISGSLLVSDDIDTNDTHSFNILNTALNPDSQFAFSDVKTISYDVEKTDGVISTDEVDVLIESDNLDVADFDEMLKSIELSNNTSDNNRFANFEVVGDFSAIGTGESVTITFSYNADDKRGFGENGDANNEASLSETKTVTIVVTGTNDQPEITFPTLVTQDETTIADFSQDAQNAYDESMEQSQLQREALLEQQENQRETEVQSAQGEFDGRMLAFDTQQQDALDAFDLQVPITAQAAYDAIIASTPEDAEDAYDASLLNSADISAAIAAYMAVINTSEARAQQAYDDSLLDSENQRLALESQQALDRAAEEQLAQQEYDDRLAAFDAQQQSALDAFDAQALIDAQEAYDGVQDVFTTAVGTISGTDDDYNDLHDISLVSKAQNINSVQLVDESGNPVLVDGEPVYVDVNFTAPRNIQDGANAPDLDLDVSDIQNLSIVLTETQDGNGTFSYEYTLKGDFNALALDEIARVTFDVKVQDDSQDVQGNDFDETDTSNIQTVTVDIVGTNDRPVVLSTQIEPIVETTSSDIEDIPSNGSEEQFFAQDDNFEENPDKIDVITSYTGTILGEDDDLTDEHEIALATTQDANYGDFKVLLVSEDNIEDGANAPALDLDKDDIKDLQITFNEITDDNGAFEYSYTMSGDFNALAEGEKAFITFDYIVTDQTGQSDENANSLTQTITLEVIGTNDKPVIDVVTDTFVDETTINSEYIIGLKTAAYDEVIANEDALAQEAYDEIYNPLEAEALQAKTDAIAQGEAAAYQQYFAAMQIVSAEAQAAYDMELADPNNTSFIDAQEAQIATFLEGKAVAVAALEQAIDDVNANAQQQYLDDLAAANLLAQAAADEVRENIEVTAQAAADAINDDITIATGLISGTDEDLTDEHDIVLDDHPLGNYNLATGESVFVEVNSDNTETSENLIISDITDLRITFDELTDDNGAFSYNYTLAGNFNALGVGDSAIVKFRVHVNDEHDGAGNESGDSYFKEITVTITGTNDQPLVTDTTAIDASITETIKGEISGPVYATPNFNGEGAGQGNGDKWTWFADTVSGTDDDDTDVHDMEIVSLQNVPTENLVTINLGQQTQVDAEVTFTQNGSNLDISDIQNGLHLWVTKLTDSDGNFEFGYDFRGDFNALGVDESAQIKFAYQINDDSGASDESASSELQYVILTVTGTNDRPKVASKVVSEIEMTETVDSDIPSQTPGSVDDVFTVFKSSIADQTTIRGNDKDVNDNHDVLVKSYDGTDPSIKVQIDGTNEVDAQISFSNLNGENNPTLSNLSLDFTPDLNNNEGKFKFDYEFKGDFNQLGLGEEVTIKINYVVNDGHPTQVSGHESGDSKVQELVFKITGTNDQPVIESIEDVTVTEPDLTVLTEDFTGSLLSSISSVPLEGSAVKYTLDTLNGEELKFKWDFEGRDSLPWNDTAFVIIDGVKMELSDIEEVGAFNTETGVLTLNLHEGTHTVTFGVINDNFNDGDYFSSLLEVKHLTGGDNIVETSHGEASKLGNVWTLNANAEDITNGPSTPASNLGAFDDFISTGVVTYENAVLNGELVEVVSDIDTNDVLTFDLLDINSGSGDITIGGANANLISDVALTLDADGKYEVTSKSFNNLGYGESVELTFNVRVDDNSGATNESNFSEYKEVSITITGTNDQPLVNDTKVRVRETHGDNDNTITHNLVSYDEDVTDAHDFNLLSIGFDEVIPDGFTLLENVKYNSDADTETAFTTEGRVNIFVKTPDGITMDDIKVDNVQLNGDQFILNGNFNILPNGEKATILIKYNVDDLENQVNDAAGNEDSLSDSKWIKVVVVGRNDKADIFVDSDLGDKDFREIKEDTNINPIYLETDGKLSINDLDFNEERFDISDIKFYDPVQQDYVTTSPNQLGTLTITQAGYWEYQVENENLNVQGLKPGNYIDEVFQVKSFDGTDTHDITVRIWGDEDKAVITGVTTGTVQEDGLDTDTITSKTEGKLDVFDKDFGDEEVQPITSQNGVYGTFSIDTDGNWTYLLDNTKLETQALREGQTEVETFTVLSKDGNTSIDVIVDVKGTNDVVNVVVPSQGDILEDSIPVDVLGMMISDIDSNSTMSPTAQYSVQLSVDEGTLLNILPSFSGTLAQINTYLSNVQYEPAANFNGTAQVSLTVTDDNGVVVPTVTTTIDVLPVNDEPEAKNKKITIEEDGSHTFSQTDFRFSDPIDGDDFESLIITKAPIGLTLNGVQVTNGTVVDVLDISNLIFEPADNEYGNPYAKMKFKVVDDGGTVNGGDDTSSKHTITFKVTPVNDTVEVEAPNQSPILEDASATLVSGLSITDVDAVSALQQYTVQLSVDNGTLSNTLITGTLSQVNTALATVSYTPDSDWYGDATVSLIVTDDNGDVLAPVTTVIEVKPVNDAPMGTDATITILEDGMHTFNASDFGFSDPVEQDAFQGVIITNAPVGLTYNGGVVPIGEIAVANLGNLKYEPADNANGNGFASIKFKVVDDGGTISGGENTSSEYTLTVDVTPVNDAPLAVDDNMGTQDIILNNSNWLTSSDVSIKAFENDGSEVTPSVNSMGIGVGGQLDENNIGAEAIEISYDYNVMNSTVVLSGFYSSYDSDAKWSVYKDGVLVDSGVVAANTSSGEQTINILSSGVYDTLRIEPVVDTNEYNDFYIKSVTSTAIVGLDAQENNILNISVLANDSDIDGDNLSITNVEQPQKGSSNILGTVIQFDPGTDFDYLAEGEKATVDFDYTITDGNGGFDTATVTVTVTGENDGLVFEKVDYDHATIYEKGSVTDTTVLATVLATDVDSTLSYSIVDGNDDNYFKIDSVSGEVSLTPLGFSDLDATLIADEVFNLKVRINESPSLYQDVDVVINVEDAYITVPTIELRDDGFNNTSTSDNITNNPNPVFDLGGLDADATSISLTSNGTPLASAIKVNDVWVLTNNTGTLDMNAMTYSVDITREFGQADEDAALNDGIYPITVVTTDHGGNSAIGYLAPNITIDTTPPSLTFSPLVIEEDDDLPADTTLLSDGMLIATIGITDATAVDLTLSNDSGYVRLDGTNIVLTQAGVNAINLDTSGTDIHSITYDITATDAAGNETTLTTQGNTVIRVNDTAPELTITNKQTTVTEDTDAPDTTPISAYVLGNVSTTDVDDGDTAFTYMVMDSNDNPYPYVTVNANGEIVFTPAGITAVNDDSLELSSLQFKVVVYDTNNEHSDSEDFNINIVRVNEAPIANDDSYLVDTFSDVVLISETFENSSMGWNINTPIDNTLTTGDTGKFLGRFGGTTGTEGVSKTFDFGVEHAGQSVTIEFDMYEIDSWDGDNYHGDNGIAEKFQVFINGAINSNTLMSMSGNNQNWIDDDNADGGTATNSNVANGWEDEVHHYSIPVVLDSDGKVMLGFGSTLQQGINDESWGIDNVTITSGTDWNSLEFDEDNSFTILPSELLANDTDIDGDDLSIVANGFTNFVGGTAMMVNGEIVFTPLDNFSGIASFDYKITDGEFFDTATVTLNVLPKADAPILDLDIVETYHPAVSSTTVLDLSSDVTMYAYGEGVDANGNMSNPPINLSGTHLDINNLPNSGAQISTAGGNGYGVADQKYVDTGIFGIWDLGTETVNEGKKVIESNEEVVIDIEKEVESAIIKFKHSKGDLISIQAFDSNGDFVWSGFKAPAGSDGPSNFVVDPIGNATFSYLVISGTVFSGQGKDGFNIKGLTVVDPSIAQDEYYEYTINIHGQVTDSSEVLSDVTISGLPGGNQVVTLDANGDASISVTSPSSITDSITGTVTSSESLAPTEEATVEAIHNMLSLIDDDSNLDFENVLDSNLPKLEEIDLSSGNHILSNISIDDVISMTSDDTLKISGENGDTIELSNTQWQAKVDGLGQIEQENGYDIYEGVTNSAIRILIEEDIDVNI